MASTSINPSQGAISSTISYTTTTYGTSSTTRLPTATSSINRNQPLPPIPIRLLKPEYSYFYSRIEGLVDFETISSSFNRQVSGLTSGYLWGEYMRRRKQIEDGNYYDKSPQAFPGYVFNIGNSQACRVTNPDGTQVVDCQRACMMPDTLMKPLTVSVCMDLAVVSIFLSNGTLELDASDRRTFKDLSEIGIRNITEFNGSRVVELTTACMADSCRNSRLGSCSERLRKIGDISAVPSKLAEISDTMHEYCQNTPSPANADIAGPGVIISYLIQTVLAFGGGFILKLLSSWLRWSFFPFAGLARLFSSKSRLQSQSRESETVDRGCIPGTRRTWTRAKYLQTRVARTRPNAALISSLVEFQEVQAYFLLAIQLATVITFRNDSEGLSLNGIINFPMAQFSASVVTFLSIDGLLPVLFVQICLQRAGMRWWYTLAITCFVYMFAEVVNARNKEMLPDFDLLWQHFRTQGSVVACGGNPSPMTYCRGNTYFYVFTRNFYTLLTARLVIVVLVVDMALWFIKSKWPRFERKMRRWDRESRWVRWSRNRLLPALWDMYCGALQVFLMMSLFFSMQTLAAIAKVIGMGADTWTFGQLVAVMVWAPIVGKYLYFNIFGIEEGFGRRLAKHYRIVHDPESSADEDDNSSIGDYHVENGVEMKPGFNSSCESQASNAEGVLPASISATPQTPRQAPPPAARVNSAASFHEPPLPREPTAAPQAQQMQAVMVGGVMIEVEDVPPSAHGHPTS